MPSAAELDALRKAVDAEPDSAAAYFRLGTALIQRGQAGDAADSLTKAVELDPGHVQAWVNLGGIRLMQWDFQGCIDANEKAQEVAPDLMQAHFNEGLGHLYLKQPEAMEKCFRRVLEIEPDNAAGEYHLAVALLALDRLEEAQRYLHQASAKGYAPQAEFVKAIERRTQSAPTTEIELGEDPKTEDGHSHT